MDSKSKKIILLLAVVILLLPDSANAGWFGDQIMGIMGKAISFITFWLSYFVGYLGGIIFALGGILLQMGLELNARIILSPMVRTGWLITRDFANLGFVLAIIMIAFATMLRIETYGVKKMLANLIIIALLVNFSLSIAGVLIDTTGIISNFFIQKVSPGNFGEVNQFAQNLAGTFQIQKLQQVSDLTELPNFQGAEDFSAKMMGLLASMFFVSLFTIIGGVVMMAIAGLVLVRYIALSLLLILMPLVWVLSIFPVFADWWRRWWSKFLEWLIFLPLALFFLYLTILIVNNFQDDSNSVTQIASSIGANNAGVFGSFLTVIKDTFQTFANMIIILGIMIGGMIAAKSASGFGATGIMNASEKVRGWAIGKVKGTTAAPGRWAGQKYLRPGAKKLASGLSRTPGLRGAGSALTSYLAKGKENVEDYQKKHIAGLTKEGKFAASETGPQAQAAKAGQLAKDGVLGEYLNKITDPQKRKKKLDMFVKAVKNMGTEKDLLKAVPHLAPEFGQEISNVVSKISPQDTANISKEGFGNVEVVAALKKNQLKELSKTINSEVKQVIEDTVSKERIRLKNIVTRNPAQIEILKKLDDINTYLANNPAWQ